MYLCITAHGTITEHRTAQAAHRRADQHERAAQARHGEQAGCDCGIVRVADGQITAGGDGVTGLALGTGTAATLGCSRWVRKAQEYLAAKAALSRRGRFDVDEE